MHANLTAAITSTTALFNALFELVSGIIFPATADATAVSNLASFAILLPIIVAVLGFLFKLVKSG